MFLLCSSEKFDNHKHLKLVASHLGAVFTYTLNHYCLFIQRQFTNTELAKYVWELKEKNIAPTIKWEILNNVPGSSKKEALDN